VARIERATIKMYAANKTKTAVVRRGEEVADEAYHHALVVVRREKAQSRQHDYERSKGREKTFADRWVLTARCLPDHIYERANETHGKAEVSTAFSG